MAEQKKIAKIPFLNSLTFLNFHTNQAKREKKKNLKFRSMDHLTKLSAVLKNKGLKF